MENEKIKKIDPIYMLAFIFLPITIMIGLAVIGVVLIKNQGIGTILSCIGVFGCVFWYGFGGQKFYKSKVASYEKELDSKGFKRNQTFYGKSQTVYCRR